MSDSEQFVAKSRPSAYVGLIPAAGVGSRLPDRISSKEILPVRDQDGRNRPVIAHLLESLALAGITEINTVIREDKQDVYDYLSKKNWQHLKFNHQSTKGTSGVPETVAIGLQAIGEKNVLFGFPDILFEPKNAFLHMTDKIEKEATDVVLGLFPTTTPSKMDMVDTDANGNVCRIEIKPSATRLKHTWILAAWTPAFSHYLAKSMRKNDGQEHLGQVMQQAIVDGLTISSSVFSDGRSLDIGTPDDLARANGWLR